MEERTSHNDIIDTMSIGIGQILVIVVVGVLLFGNFSGVLKDLAGGINVFKETLQQNQGVSESQGSDSGSDSKTTTSAPESASKEVSSEESEARKGL